MVGERNTVFLHDIGYTMTHGEKNARSTAKHPAFGCDAQNQEDLARRWNFGARVDSERATSTSTRAQQFCRTISQVVERSREDFFTLTLPPLLHHSIPRRSSGARLQLLRPEASGACPPRGCCSSKELLLLFCPYIACYLAHDGWGIEEDGISG